MSNSVQSNSTQSSHGKLPEPEPEEEIDFFQDMQPSFRKAQKVSFEQSSYTKLCLIYYFNLGKLNWFYIFTDFDTTEDR